MHFVRSRSITPHYLVLFSDRLLRFHIVKKHMQDLSAALSDVLEPITRLQLEQSADHTVRLADNFQVGSDAFTH